MSLEPYVVLLFLLVPLVEWVVRRVREASARRPTVPQPQPAPGPPRQVLAAPPLPVEAPPPRVKRRAAAARPPVPAQPPPLVGPRRRDLRRAVVLMTILGPPRAVEPHDVRPPS